MQRFQGPAACFQLGQRAPRRRCISTLGHDGKASSQNGQSQPSKRPDIAGDSGSQAERDKESESSEEQPGQRMPTGPQRAGRFSFAEVARSFGSSESSIMQPSYPQRRASGWPARPSAAYRRGQKEARMLRRRDPRSPLRPERPKGGGGRCRSLAAAAQARGGRWWRQQRRRDRRTKQGSVF